jgi:hypothetical protein
MTLYIPLALILQDADSSISQGTREDAEAIEGDVVTRLHVVLLKFIITRKGGIPIDFLPLSSRCNLKKPVGEFSRPQ